MANQKSIEQGKKNLAEHGKATQFNGRTAAEAGRKGGTVTGERKRKKFAFRNNLKMLLALPISDSPEMKKVLKKMGLNPDDEYNWEMLMTIAVLQKAVVQKDLNAVQMILENMGEDPYTIREEKRVKMEQKVTDRITNSDGFLAAMNGTAKEVFDDDEGGDTPDSVDDGE